MMLVSLERAENNTIGVAAEVYECDLICILLSAFVSSKYNYESVYVYDICGCRESMILLVVILAFDPCYLKNEIDAETGMLH